MADATVTVTMLDDERIRDIVREEIAEHERRRALGALGALSREQVIAIIERHAAETRRALADAVSRSEFRW